MSKNDKKKPIPPKKSRTLNAEEKRELKEKSLKDIKGLLQSLDSWRSESMSSAFRF